MLTVMGSLSVQQGNFTTFTCKESPSAAGAGTHLIARTGFVAAGAGSAVVVYGGVLPDGSKTSAVWWISRDRMEWRLTETFGEAPGPRSGCCGICDPVKGKCVPQMAQIVFEFSTAYCKLLCS